MKCICNETKALESYKEDRRPVFKSSPSQFMTIIYSVDYNDAGQVAGNGDVNRDVNGYVNGYVNGEVNTLTPSQKLVYDTVNNNPGIQTKQIADVLKRSPRTIEKHLAFLAKSSFIEHKDSDMTGGYYVKK